MSKPWQHSIQNPRRQRKEVLARPGHWPFLDSVTIISSKYVDPMGSSMDSREWRDMFKHTKKFNDMLFGIVEKYIIATRGEKGYRTAWVHRD